MAAPEITRVAAYGLVVKDGSILLCRISASVPGAAGQWTLPGGGLDFAEDPRDAVVREVFEETGLQVRVADLVTVDSMVSRLPQATYHSLRIIYRVEVLDGELTNEVDGTTDLCGWFTPQEALHLPLVSLARAGISLAFPE
jgi:8-oxo-dGTP diphosphatase